MAQPISDPGQSGHDRRRGATTGKERSERLKARRISIGARALAGWQAGRPRLRRQRHVVVCSGEDLDHGGREPRRAGRGRGEVVGLTSCSPHELAVLRTPAQLRFTIRLRKMHSCFGRGGGNISGRYGTSRDFELITMVRPQGQAERPFFGEDSGAGGNFDAIVEEA